jgi:hypothetical protein
MRVNWLIIAHFANAEERRAGIAHLTDLQVKADPGLGIYVAVFGPTKKSQNVLCRWSGTGIEMKILHEFSADGVAKDFTAQLKDMAAWLKRNRMSMYGLLYYGHGGAIRLGPWKSPQRLADTSDFARTVLRPLRPHVLYFDSCHMLSIASLYEFEPYVKYVVGSPSYSAARSMIDCAAFGKLRRFRDDSEVRAYLRSWVKQYAQFKLPKYSCILALDLSRLGGLVRDIQRDELHFGPSTQLHRDDWNQHDLHGVLSTERVRKKVDAMVIAKPKCNTVRGPSVERKVPNTWPAAFKSLRWYKAMAATLYDE